MVVVCGADSVIREITWGGDYKECVVRDVRLDSNKQGQDEAFYVTCMTSSMSGKNLFGGTNTGRVRVYDWPLPQELPPCFEILVHAGPVTALMVAPDDNFILTCGEDGCVFVLGIKVMERGIEIKGTEDPNPRAFDTDTALVSQEEFEEQFGQVKELNKIMEDMKIEHAFKLHSKTNEILDDLKQVVEENERWLAAKDGRFEELHQKHEALKRENAEELEKKDKYHVQAIHELENQYEHKLALEFHRFDRLSEEVEAVQQRCEGLLEVQQQEHQWELRAREQAALKMEKELRQQIERLQEDKNYNDKTYREVLDQQEGEYETELQQLITAAESEMNTERENIGKLRATLQKRKTKEGRLRKKMQDARRSKSAREVMFALEKMKRERLEATIHHFEQEMHERGLILAEKEKTILELRSNNSTLNNFRFVLDHRLQQLMEEKGPITAHIEGLEAYIRGMDDELVSEFGEKKEAARLLRQKELKLVRLTQEVKSLRSQVCSKDRTIVSFKRELSSMVHIGPSKELEQAVKDTFKMFVKGKDAITNASRSRTSRPVRSEETKGVTKGDSSANVAGEARASIAAAGDEDTKAVGSNNDEDSDGSSDCGDFHHRRGGRKGLENVDDSAELTVQTREAHMQRDLMEKRHKALATKLADAKLDAAKHQRAKLAENSALMSECNSLRMENIRLKRQNDFLRREGKQTTGIAEQQPVKQRGRLAAPPLDVVGPEKTGVDVPDATGSGGGFAGDEARLNFPWHLRRNQPETKTSLPSMPAPWDPAKPTVAITSTQTAKEPETSAMHISEPEVTKRNDARTAMSWRSKTIIKDGNLGKGGMRENDTGKNGESVKKLLPKRQRYQQQQEQQKREEEQAVGAEKTPEQLQEQPRIKVSAPLLSSPSLNHLYSSRHPLSQHRQPLSAYNRHQALGKAGAERGRTETGARGVGLTPASSETGLVKGGTRGLYVQAVLAGNTLHLERSLDDKERELSLQRRENSTLREQIRAMEAGRTNNTSNNWYRSKNNINGSPLSRCFLAPTWGGSGRGGTSPYPITDGSRPVTPISGWSIDERGAAEGGSGKRVAAGLSAPPPGAHVTVLRGEVGGNDMDPDLIVVTSGSMPNRLQGV